MNAEIFITAAVIAIMFLLGKILEMKFILKEDKPLKFLMRDGLIVYLSVIVGSYVLQQFNNNDLGPKSPGAFTDNPDF